jgi:hypothetical protein
MAAAPPDRQAAEIALLELLPLIQASATFVKNGTWVLR